MASNSFEISENKFSSICQAIKLCSFCFKIIKQNQNHSFGQKICKTCLKNVPHNHLCFVQPFKKKTDKRILFVFNDFESLQDVLVEGTTDVYKHIPTLCVTQQACPECIDNNDLTILCNSCGVREQVFDVDPVKQFVEYVTQDMTLTNVICLAHNSKSYDGQFVLNHIVSNNIGKPEVILNGTKIIKMQFRKTIFIVSLNYFYMSLSKLPKAFGFAENKGYFPHLFNSEEN